MPQHFLSFFGLLLLGLIAPQSRAASNDGRVG